MMRKSSLKFYVQCVLWIGMIVSSVKLNAQNIGFDFEKDHHHISIPFELYNNLIILTGTIEKKSSLNFILDTGVRPTIFIDKDIIDSLHIDYQREVQLFGFGNEEQLSALVTEPISLIFSGISSNGISMLVLNSDVLQFDTYLGVKIHGIIGYDLFSRFVVKINYAKKRIELYEPSTYRIKSKYHPMDIEIVDGKPISNIYVGLNPSKSLQARLLIDTGASHALMLNKDSHQNIVLPDNYIETFLGRGLAGVINGYLGRISEMHLSDKKLFDVITSFPVQQTINSGTEKTRHGSIGGELLKKFTVIFDYIHYKVYVKPNASFKLPFEYNMSGLEFIALGANLNRFVINSIRENSPASQVDLNPGDILVSINNISSKNLDLSRIYTNLNLKEGKKINLTVYRDGRYISQAFRLKREI